MTGWRHARAVFEITVGGRTCRECYESGSLPVCADPQPDPGSPCGVDGCEGWYAHQSWNDTSEEPGAQCAHEPREDCHPHLPTLCLHCGHGLEAA